MPAVFDTGASAHRFPNTTLRFFLMAAICLAYVSAYAVLRVYPKQGNPFDNKNGRPFDLNDLLSTATERHQDPAHCSTMEKSIGKSPPDFLSVKPDGPHQDLNGNQFCQIKPTNQVHEAHGNETTFASCFNLGPQVTRDYTPPKYALNTTNRLGGKFVPVASCATAKPEAADSAADEHHAKIVQERSVSLVITLLPRGSVGVRPMLSGSTLVNQSNQKTFEPGPLSPVISSLHDGANSQISLLPWYTCITAQYQLLLAFLLYHACKGTNVNGRQSPSLTGNLEEATSSRGPAYVILAKLKSGQHETQLLDSAVSALRFAVSLFLPIATSMFRRSLLSALLRFASTTLTSPPQVASLVMQAQSRLDPTGNHRTIICQLEEIWKSTMWILTINCNRNSNSNPTRLNSIQSKSNRAATNAPSAH
jgi:hypothetical protein